MMAEEQPVKPKRRRGPGRPFRKGQSGNPGGAPRKGSSLVEHLATVLKEVDPESGKTHVELLAEKYVELAIAGNVTALENIMARFHGRPEQGIRLSGDDERPLHVRHSPRESKDADQ